VEELTAFYHFYGSKFKHFEDDIMSKLFSFENGWIIRDSEFTYANEIMKASAYSLSNGYMGNRGTLEDVSSKQKFLTGTVINGLYDMPDGDLTKVEIVNIPNWTSIKIWIDDELLDLEQGTILYFDRHLNLKEPILYRELKWQSPKGKRISIKTERMVNSDNIHHTSVRWQLSADDYCKIIIESGIDADVYNVRADSHFKNTFSSFGDENIFLEAMVFEDEERIGIATNNELITTGKLESISIVNPNKLYIAQRFCIELESNQKIDLLKTSAIYTSKDTHESLDFFCNLKLLTMREEGYEALKQKHLKTWAKIWDESDIVIEGDEEAQIALRFAVYHLVNSAPRHRIN
jgi:trehalose/maltose hydrolase-like predicted phosphorylase